MAKIGSVHRKLNSDALGVKGELAFSSLCNDAQLICNRSDRDRTGWDFIIEFQFTSSSDCTTLDMRKAPISCHFQQKTMWDSSDTFKMRLSSAERIAKELKPTFVYVLKVNNNLEFTGAFIIHILGEPLKVILKRLRVEEAKKKKSKLNSIFMTMKVSVLGEPIEPTGAALRAALERICGSDPHQYVDVKKSQLKELGFESHALTTKMTIHFDGPKELVDVFLGLKKDVRISDVETFVTRFGIDLPTQPTFVAGGKMTLDPAPAAQCVVTYRRQRLGHPAAFDGEIVLPPRFVMEAGKTAALIRTEFFNLRYSESAVAFESKPEVFKTLRCSVRLWRNFFELSLGLAEGDGEFQIRVASFPKTLALPAKGKNFKGLEPSYYRYFAEISKSLINILELAGLSEEFPLTFNELRAEAGQIRTVDAVLKGEVDKIGSLSLSSPLPADRLELPTKMSVAYVNFLQIGSATIGHTMKAEMSVTQVEDMIHWKSEKLAAFDLRLLDDSSDDFQRYAKEMQVSMSADGLIAPDSSARTGGET
jgi:hypothetical protein